MRRSTFHLSPHLFVVLAGMVLILAMAGDARAQEDQACIPELGTDPALFDRYPLIDGIIGDHPVPVSSSTPTGIKNDPGWNQALKLNLDNVQQTSGTYTPGLIRTVRLLMGKTRAGVTPPRLYIGLQVESPVNPNANDTIVLTFATTSTAAEDWRIHIKPFTAASAGGGMPIFSNVAPDLTQAGVTFWRGSATWNADPGIQPLAAPHTLPAGHFLTTNIKTSRDNSFWNLEMEIPLDTSGTPGNDTDIFFPSMGTFRMYFNVITAVSLPTGNNYYQAPWPSTIAGRMGAAAPPFDVWRLTPPKDGANPIWGTVSLGARSQCTGVSLGVLDIGVKSGAALVNTFGAFDPAPNPFPSIATCNTLTDFSQPSDLGPVNVVAARPQNTTLDNTLTGVQVNNMAVTFKIANWGVPSVGDWQKIASGNPALITSNPAGGPPLPAPVGMTPGTAEYTMDWRLSFKQSCIYLQANGAHQCILVEMDSTDPAARFLNHSVARNMDFVPASVFTRDAEISARGYGAPPAGRPNHLFLIYLDRQIQNYENPDGRPRNRRWSRLGSLGQATTAAAVVGRDPSDRGDRVQPFSHRPRLESEDIRRLVPRHFPRGVTESLIWTARAYRSTGLRIDLSGTPHQFAEYVGGFGYVAGHKGQVESWLDSFTGGGGLLQRVTDNLYTVEIPPEGSAIVNTRIESVEPTTTPTPVGGLSKFSIGLRGGVAIPHDTLNNFFGPSVALTADVEYHATNQFSLFGLLGYRRFRGDFAFIDDFQIGQFTAGTKGYLSTGNVRPFVNFGMGGFVNETGDVRFGVHGGGGLQFIVSPHVSLEGEYNYHNVFTPGTNFKFSTVQGGVRFRF